MRCAVSRHLGPSVILVSLAGSGARPFAENAAAQPLQFRVRGRGTLSNYSIRFGGGAGGWDLLGAQARAQRRSRPCSRTAGRTRWEPGWPARQQQAPIAQCQLGCILMAVRACLPCRTLRRAARCCAGCTAAYEVRRPGDVSYMSTKRCRIGQRKQRGVPIGSHPIRARPIQQYPYTRVRARAIACPCG